MMTMRVAMIATAQIGRLMKKTDCQPRCSTSNPPTMGPRAMPIPDTPAQTPMARARSRASRKVLVRIDSVVGKMKAPPMPIRPREMMRRSGELANPATAENVANHARPKVSARRRP